MWNKVFKSGLTKFFKGCLPQNLISLPLNTLVSHKLCITKMIICMLGTCRSPAYLRLTSTDG